VENTYLKTLGAVFMLLLLLSITFNFVIDPYRIYTGPRIDSINKIKPEMDTHLRMAKAWIVYDKKPDRIISGSSRADYGLNPEHEGWGGKGVYNLGLSGGNMYEVLRYFQHAHAINPLKQVVLSVDFYMFNTYYKNTPDFSENRFVVTFEGVENPSFCYINKYTSLFSFDTLLSSITTVKSQKRPYFYEPPHMENGQRHWTNRETYIPVAGGHHNFFLANEFAHMKSWYLIRPNYKYSFSDPETGESRLDHFRKYLEIAYKDNVDLRILISPSHARLWEVISAIGLWDIYEEWKRELVRINEEVAQKYGVPAFSLWDFSGYNKYTTEELPALGDLNSKMKWYWEDDHYKNALGDLVLDQIFHIKPGESGFNKNSKIQQGLTEYFGIVLTSKNIENHLKEIRRAQHHYRITHKSDFAEIKDLAEKVISERSHPR